jgi:hypothetical protein
MACAKRHLIQFKSILSLRLAPNKAQSSIAADVRSRKNDDQSLILVHALAAAKIVYIPAHFNVRNPIPNLIHLPYSQCSQAI